MENARKKSSCHVTVRRLFMVKGTVVKNNWFLFNLHGIFFEIISSHYSSTNAHNEWHIFRRKKNAESETCRIKT